MDHDEHDDEASRQECIEKFSVSDYIMEPGVFATLQKWEENTDCYLHMVSFHCDNKNHSGKSYR